MDSKRPKLLNRIVLNVTRLSISQKNYPNLNFLTVFLCLNMAFKCLLKYLSSSLRYELILRPTGERISGRITGVSELPRQLVNLHKCYTHTSLPVSGCARMCMYVCIY